MACEICRKIEALDDEVCEEYIECTKDDMGEEIRQVTLGRLDDLLAMDCDFHTSLLRSETDGGDDNDDMADDNYFSMSKHKKYSSIVAQMYRGRLEIMHWNYEDPKNGTKRGHTLVGPLLRYSYGDHQGIGLPLDRSWIDQNLLRKWIGSCDTHHGEMCRARWLKFDDLEHQPCLLIDAMHGCLVDFSGQEYFALSYVWGSATSILTTTSNLDRLKRPGALAENNVWTALTEVVRNTIELIKLFDSPFLWVDALCVLQDDHAKRQKELEKMSYIFANASVTIIAGTGADANHGLPGIQGISGPRVLRERRVFSLPGGKQYIGALFTGFGHLSNMDPRYSSRAWTFQEHVLSHRKIYFEGQNIRWECEQAEWCEDVNHEMEINQPSDVKHVRELRRVLHGIDSVNPCDLASFVDEFNHRDLTYPQDAPFACAGIITLLSHSEKGFISGMPAQDFDIALLWQPEGCVERRLAATRSSAGLTDSGNCLPSWSWIGWRCGIETDCWNISRRKAVHREFSQYNVAGSFTIQLVPTVFWQYTESLSTNRSQLDGLTNVQQRVRYIFCKTRRCVSNLTVGGRMPNFTEPGLGSLYKRHPFQYEILDSSQRRIGLINVSPASDQDTNQKYTAAYTRGYIETKPLLRGTLLDLVEISASNVSITEPLEEIADGGTPAEWMRMINDIGGPDGSQKIYNVLWIEWKGEYAERKALGWVDSRAWDALKLVDIDLALG